MSLRTTIFLPFSEVTSHMACHRNRSDSPMKHCDTSSHLNETCDESLHITQMNSMSIPVHLRRVTKPGSFSYSFVCLRVPNLCVNTMRSCTHRGRLAEFDTLTWNISFSLFNFSLNSLFSFLILHRLSDISITKNVRLANPTNAVTATCVRHSTHTHMQWNQVEIRVFLAPGPILEHEHHRHLCVCVWIIFPFVVDNSIFFHIPLLLPYSMKNRNKSRRQCTWIHFRLDWFVQNNFKNSQVPTLFVDLFLFFIRVESRFQSRNSLVWVEIVVVVTITEAIVIRNRMRMCQLIKVN